MWSVRGLMYLEVENVLAQNKMSVWDFLKKWENAKKRMWRFHEIKATRVLNRITNCDIYISVDWSIS